MIPVVEAGKTNPPVGEIVFVLLPRSDHTKTSCAGFRESQSQNVPVLCLRNGWCFAARAFRSRRGASDEHIPKWICKERATKPGAKRTAALRVAPSLACGFVARRSQPHFGGCSLLAPRHRPNWAQQNTSHLGDTTTRVPRRRGSSETGKKLRWCPRVRRKRPPTRCCQAKSRSRNWLKLAANRRCRECQWHAGGIPVGLR